MSGPQVSGPPRAWLFGGVLAAVVGDVDGKGCGDGGDVGGAALGDGRRIGEGVEGERGC